MSLKSHYESIGKQLSSLVHLEKMAGNWDKALQLGKSDIAQEIGTKSLMKVRLVLAEIHIRRIEFKEAIEYLAEVKDYALKSD